MANYKRLIPALMALVFSLVFFGCPELTDSPPKASPKIISAITELDKTFAVEITAVENSERGNASGPKITSGSYSNEFPGIYFIWDSKQENSGYLKVDVAVYDSYENFFITTKEGSDYWDFFIVTQEGQQATEDGCYIFYLPHASDNKDINMVFISEYKLKEDPPDGSVFVAVTDITGVPSTVAFGTPVTLSPTVSPSNATNKTIAWSVIDAGTTGATVSGSTLTTTAVGSITLRATIVNGKAPGTDFTKDFLVRSGNTKSNVTVYSVGDVYKYLPGTATTASNIPSYWVGTEHTGLSVPGGASGQALDITVVNGIVYTAGWWCENGNDRGNIINHRPCYWVGTERVDLSGGTGDAVAITVADGKVYAAGYYYDGRFTPCYWAGAERIVLSTLNNSLGIVSAITVVNGEVYTAGFLITGTINSSQIQEPCYWIGTERIDLSIPNEYTFAEITDIKVSNGTVYVAGYYSHSGVGDRVPCYWAGTERIDLGVPGSGFTNAITIANGTVYTVGAYYNEPCLWTGTERTSLDLGYRNIYSNAVTVVDGVVYIAGTSNYNKNQPCYWVNTTTERTDLGNFDLGGADNMSISKQYIVVN